MGEGEIGADLGKEQDQPDVCRAGAAESPDHRHGPDADHRVGARPAGKGRADEFHRGIDNYRNPHIYTRNTVHRAVGENQYALGRALGLEVGLVMQRGQQC